MKKIYCVLLVCFVFTGFMAQRAIAATTETVDQIVATVNDDIITKSELNQQVEQVKLDLEASGTSLPDMKTLRHKVLENMVLESVQLQLAERADITVSDTERDKAIEKILMRNHETLTSFKTQLAKNHMTFATFEKQIKKELILQKLQEQEVAAQIKISDEAVEALSEKLKRQDGVTKQYHLNDILMPLSDDPSTAEVAEAKARAVALIARLKKGENFSQLALADSASHTAMRGGDFGWHTLAALPEVFVPVVKAMQVGEVSEPIQTGNGFHILKLLAIKSDNQTIASASNEKRLQQARELLFQREFNQHLQTWLQTLRDSAYIKTYE